jgi:hypothetical protein
MSACISILHGHRVLGENHGHLDDDTAPSGARRRRDGGRREAERAPGAALARRRRVAQDRRSVRRGLQQLHPGTQSTSALCQWRRALCSALIIYLYMQGACVMNTLDSVVDALASDPARKFIVVEQVSTPSSSIPILPLS